MTADVHEQLRILLETHVWFDLKSGEIRYPALMDESPAKSHSPAEYDLRGSIAKESAKAGGDAVVEQRFERMKFYEAFRLIAGRALRPSTKARTAISESAIGHSVLESFIEGKLAEVDLNDPENVWRILVQAAKRHCGKYIQRAKRHPLRSLDDFGSQDADAIQPQFESTRELPPPEIVMIAECLSLLKKVGFPLEACDEDALEEAITKLYESPESRLGLVERLSDLERKVLALRLCGWTFHRIADKLDVSRERVRIAWESIQGKATMLGTQDS